MHRSRVSASGGRTYMDKFRNGFCTIQSEVNKLEQISADLPNLPSTNYFNDELVLMRSLPSVYEGACTLYDTVTNSTINIDPIEQRLLALRQKLNEIEENPKLLERGYQRYVPPDSQIDDLAELSSFSIMDLDFHSNLLPTEDKQSKFCEFGFNKNFCSKTPIKNPKLANALSILQRWKNYDNKSEKEIRETKLSKNSASPLKLISPPNSCIPVWSGKKLNSTASLAQYKTPNKYSPSIKPSTNIKPLDASNSVLYETVEFTPGMTTRIMRRKLF